MRRLAMAALVLCVCVGSARADQVTLKNGDRLTGTVVKADDKTLTMKTELAGEVRIAWDSITSLSSTETFHVQLKDGRTVLGGIKSAEGNVSVAPKEGAEIAAPKGTILAVRSDAEQREYDKSLHPRLFDFWSGLFDAGLSVTEGNSSTTSFTMAAKAARVAPKNKLTLFANAVYAADNTTPPSRTTAHAIHAGLRDDITVTDGLFVFGFTDFDYDEFQHLDLRNVLGGGFGQHLIHNAKTQFDIFGGGSFNQEYFGAYQTTNPAPPPATITIAGFSRKSGEGVFGETLATKLGPRTTFSEQFSIYPNFSNAGDYRMTFDATATTKLKSWLSWQVTASDHFISNPPTNLKGNDLLLSTGLRLTFGKGVF